MASEMSDLRDILEQEKQKLKDKVSSMLHACHKCLWLLSVSM